MDTILTILWIVFGVLFSLNLINVVIFPLGVLEDRLLHRNTKIWMGLLGISWILSLGASAISPFMT